MKSTRRLTTTAYHEAGHAVAAYLLHWPIRSVAIVPSEDGETLGMCRLAGWGRRTSPEWDASPWTIRRVRRCIMHYLAGHVAERRVRGRNNWQGSRGDLMSATYMVMYLVGSPEETGPEMDRLWRATEQLLNESRAWAAVMALAEALLKQPTLRAQEVRMVIRQALEG